MSGLVWGVVIVVVYWLLGIAFLADIDTRSNDAMIKWAKSAPPPLGVPVVILIWPLPVFSYWLSRRRWTPDE